MLLALRSALGLAMAASALAGCGQGQQAQPEQGAPAGEAPGYAARIVHNPTTPETIAATGVLTLEIPTDMGGGRTFSGSNGLIARAHILSRVDPETRFDGRTQAEVFGVPADAITGENGPVLLSVLSFGAASAPDARPLCAEGQPTHMLYYTAPDSALTLVMPVTGGAPGEEGAIACPLLRYNRL